MPQYSHRSEKGTYPYFQLCNNPFPYPFVPLPSQFFFVDWTRFFPFPLLLLQSAALACLPFHLLYQPAPLKIFLQEKTLFPLSISVVSSPMKYDVKEGGEEKNLVPWVPRFEEMALDEKTFYLLQL